MRVTDSTLLPAAREPSYLTTAHRDSADAALTPSTSTRPMARPRQDTTRLLIRARHFIGAPPLMATPPFPTLVDCARASHARSPGRAERLHRIARFPVDGDEGEQGRCRARGGRS